MPITSACVVVLDESLGRVLGVSRRATDLWGLPGGHRERGESPAETAARELYEETGLSPLSLVPLCETPSEPGETTAIFIAPACHGRPVQETTEGRVRWVTWQQLFAGPFGAQNRQIHTALAQRLRKLFALSSTLLRQ
jgi:8-oxo-dGTP pyrophosphatase MutT (NUDIX family)